MESTENLRNLPTADEREDAAEREREGLFKDGQLTPKGRELLEDVKAGARQVHGWKRSS